MEVETDHSTEILEVEEDSPDIIFTPTMSIQRYNSVFEILSRYDPPVLKVVDFGCNKCTFFKILKMIPTVEEIAGVDIDLSILETNVSLVRPLTYEYLFKRSHPLTVRLFHGSAAKFDARLADYDAVVGIEIIEHLEAAILEGFVEVVFHCIKPRLVIFTTPNADFNVCFKNFSGKRNWDHKFEWTRLEFQTWCNNIVNDYPNYTVRFEGIGEGPPDTEIYGCCSQMAVFERLKATPVNNKKKTSKPYHLVAEAEHPYFIETRNTEQKLLYELVYYLNVLSHDYIENDEEEDYAFIRIESLMAFPKIRELCSSTDDLRKFLADNYPLTEDGSAVKYYLSKKSDDDSSDSEDFIENEEILDHVTSTANNINKENWDS